MSQMPLRTARAKVPTHPPVLAPVTRMAPVGCTGNAGVVHCTKAPHRSAASSRKAARRTIMAGKEVQVELCIVAGYIAGHRL